MQTIQPKVTAGEFELTVADESAWEALAPLLPNLILLLGTLLIFIYMIVNVLNFSKSINTIYTYICLVYIL